MKFKTVLYCGVFFLCGAILAVIYLTKIIPATYPGIISPIGKSIEEKTRPLDVYAIEALAKRKYGEGKIEFGEIIATRSAFLVRKFTFTSDGARVSGLAHLPITKSADLPVIVQVRGYVDREIYESGTGTVRSAEVFAANGFVSLAPDFLGYGDSDNPSADVFEERFQTYTALLNLYFSVLASGVGNGKVGFWAHSNGGQIVLTALEVLEMKRGEAESDIPAVPATLWAPVTSRFPYSILYYTDEAPDGGRKLREKLAAFEAQYDAEQYSLNNYPEYLKGPLVIHQGTADDAVPVRWNTDFAGKLKDLGADLTYYQYEGADHNLRGAWETVVRRDLDFFTRYLR